MRNGTSDLEQEFELEFGDISAPDRLGEFDDGDQEFEISGSDDETADDEELGLDNEFEALSDSGNADEYVERFMEIASRTYESETELDESVNRVLGEIEREYFWGSLKRAVKKGIRGGVGRLVNTAKQVAKNHPLFKTLQGITSLHRKGLRGLLGQIATAAASATPYGGAINGALNALGFQPGAPAQEREAWENFVNVAQNAYQDLAENLNETASMAGAHEQASRSLAKAMRRHRSGPQAKGGGRRVIRLRPGQKITIICTP